MNRRREILAISFEDLSIQNIMKLAGGRNASRKLVQRKLDAAGDMKSHCSFANSEKQIRPTPKDRAFLGDSNEFSCTN